MALFARKMISFFVLLENGPPHANMRLLIGSTARTTKPV
eukprot:CAMPEP_0114010892 /NCGR_PEP_ID=MMETSP0372-20130328/7964_1 /TAXON_ID=340204 /ORGANISM="Lankesteria abbotti" /LENGTH=38 /assembly_acc=CAM_ASM_000359